MAQTYADIEIILVDDGSTDGSAEICDCLMTEDKRIQVIHQNNSGVSNARNEGIKVATGAYICFIDADDLLKINMLELLLNCMQVDNCDLAICGYNVKAIRSTNKYMNRRYIDDLSLNPDFFGEIIANGMLNPLWNKMFRRSLIGNFIPGVAMGEDLLFVLDYLSRSKSISIIPDILYQYIKRTGSATTKVRNNAFKNVLNLINARNTFVSNYFHNKELDKKIYEQSCAEIYLVCCSAVDSKLRRKEIIGLFHAWKDTPEYDIFINSYGNDINDVLKVPELLYLKIYISTFPKRILKKICIK